MKCKPCLFTIGLLLWISFSCSEQKPKNSLFPETFKLSKTILADKIKGGWAGQTIGCTYGGPVEFLFNGTMIQDYTPIPWPDGAIKKYYDTFPGLYDDVYMDLTFVRAFERFGLDAPLDSIAQIFARSEYPLWHANQAARYNILHGIMPSASGDWINNPHADDIDFQIEADYAGLMSPGMPNTASAFSDKIGHMICCGDGWYGGVFVAAMYSLAFISNDVNFIVSEALKTIPAESSFHQCISDVIGWHKQYPADWKQTWFECQKKWTQDYGCPDGVYASFDIDAKINSAYVAIGLLYGQGDFSKTIDIATRCGQDADCNPSTAAGILGTMLGYSNVSEYWKKNLYEVEDRNFAYTSLSLNNVYELGLKHALQVVAKNGGQVNDDEITIVCQQPQPVKLEQSFPGHFPIDRVAINKHIFQIGEFSFLGIGVVFRGYVQSSDAGYVARVEMSVDGVSVETASLPVSSSNARRTDLFWKYQLPKGKHTVTFNWLNANSDAMVNFVDAIVYSDALSCK
ncbi:MAG: hypothetical protein A2W90_07285 [Bacteroidetes bacterium GWF2_42_66]|nr:MAG: hypothetical protein A2W92_07275 [Bacteroidetes bacterium GWA2_42_15]OFX96894.1 MAG: hypothetical protein A2W89_19985 [Bacteroidetes bacterium GWE2_42_39]OFY44651.1 MAG: hypothetical protein A2W90_07285 [Bacteroidetes bacterium GWF2_42_66]HAZ01616.1 hypothetical protein [Marinilabiliales bacterium]HBL75064.1 hypothetical protein [Prolixibacteraceae bacterium]